MNLWFPALATGLDPVTIHSCVSFGVEEAEAFLQIHPVLRLLTFLAHAPNSKQEQRERGREAWSWLLASPPTCPQGRGWQEGRVAGRAHRGSAGAHLARRSPC
jgi:hypothetical protein